MAWPEALNILAWPALLKVLVCFGLLLAAARQGLNLGLCLTGAGLLLALLMGQGPGALLLSWLAVLVQKQTLTLVAMVALIMLLSHLMRQAGLLEEVVDNLTALVRSPRTVAGVLPALIGLLPMPGGALFSAPMVAAACPNPQERGDLLATINYWFRHHGEYWWPLYPGVILTLSLLNLPAWKFMAALMPLALVHVASGAWFLLRPLPTAGPAPSTRPGAGRRFLVNITPILIVVAAIPLGAVGRALLARGGYALGHAWPLLTGLAAAVCWVAFGYRFKAAAVARALVNRQVGAMLLLVVGVMTFQGMMKESGAVAAISGELRDFGIPALAMIVLLPLISGFLMGIAVGYVAASFPLLVPLLAQYQGSEFLAYVSLAFAAGFVGMLASPVHLCFVVSRDYFKTRFALCYRCLAGPLLAGSLAMIAWHWLLKHLNL